MKKLNQKYIGLGLMTMATVLGLGSCADSINSVVPNIPLTNKNIGYDVSVNSDINYVPTEAEAKTRAASMANDGFQTPHVLQGYGKTLYLHPLVQTMQTDPNAKNVATRGTQINDVNDMSDFGVLGKYYSDGELSTTSTNYFYNIRTTKVGAMTESRAWPISTYNLAVYAYHPYNAGEVSLSAADAVGAPVVTYTVNSANPNTMSDFMTASATGKKVTDGNSIPLTFNHNLAAINFVVGADMTPGTIKSVTFKGIYNTGDFTIGGNWSFAGKETSDITFSGLDVAIDGDENDPIITSARTFFMIPQSFDAQAQAIEIVFNDGESDHTLTTTLAGTNWQAGKTITYKISASAITTLNLGSISFASAYSYNVLPKSTWANGDMVGLYVKDQKGVLRNENVKLTYNSTSGKWDVDQSTVGANSLLYSPQYDYYVYYPYSASGLANEGNTNAKTRASMVAGSANTFFAAGIAAFNPSTNQSSNISSSDLQTAKGLISTVDASSINFTMAHEMALYKVTLGSKTIPVTHIYDVNANSWSNSTDTKSVKALNNFAGGTITGLYRPNNTGDDYYALVNPAKAYTFKSASGQPNGWYNNALSVAANALTRGGVGSGTAQSDSAYIYTAYAYSYTGSVQTFTAPISGDYKLEVWGAQGGNSYDSGNGYSGTVYGGKGGYCSGTVTYPSYLNVYVYVGQSGEDINRAYTFNGGGKGGPAYNGRSGGGATDVRLTEGNTWNEFNSLKSRIIVAAGGGGAQHFVYGCNGGNAGGLSGQDGLYWGYYNSYPYSVARGAAQTYGGGGGSGEHSDGDGTSGLFGIGGSHNEVNHGSGGGGGYYGGGGGGNVSGGVGSGAGGSSFISGYPGCDAIAESSTEDHIVHTGQPNHYSGYVFVHSVMIDGGSVMPSPSGGTETGHSGNGYCIITWQQLP